MTRRSAPFILSPATQFGYPVVTMVRPDGLRATVKVHRLVCSAFHGPAPEDKQWVLHGNGNRADNRASNLRWGTPLENSQDMEEHGTRLRGELHPRAILTVAQVRTLRESDDWRELAVLYGVSRTAARLAREGQNWRSIS